MPKFVDAYEPAKARKLLEQGNGIPNVKNFGAVGDGTTDDSAAFLAAYTFAVSQIVGGIGGYGQAEIYVPPGKYLITQPGAMMKDVGPISLTRGLKYRGAGRDLTVITFSPTANDQFLFDNEDDWGFLTISDMSFISTVATSSFMKSYSPGNGLGYQVFNQINWEGTWKYGFDLTGTNNNDHMTWRDCGIFGAWSSFLHSGPTGTSDQFLEYNFFACHMECTKGDFVSLARGGNVNVWGGSFIHSGDGSQSTSTEQCLFRMGEGVVGHAGGMANLLVQGIRVEHRHQNSILVKCDWQYGSVKFVNCDTAAMATILTSPTLVKQADFGTNTIIPNVVFDNCALMGYHKYRHNILTRTFPQTVSYRDCFIANADTAADFITYTDTGGIGTVGSTPLIKFEQCQGKNVDRNILFDANLGWQVASNAVLTNKTVSMHKALGGLVNSSGSDTENPQHVTLPLNAIITRVRSFKGVGGASSSTDFAYTLTDADSQVIAQAVGDGITSWANGFQFDSGPLHIPCSTTNKRTLTLTPTNIAESHASTYFLVDFLG